MLILRAGWGRGPVRVTPTTTPPWLLRPRASPRATLPCSKHYGTRSRSVLRALVWRRRNNNGVANEETADAAHDNEYGWTFQLSAAPKGWIRLLSILPGTRHGRLEGSLEQLRLTERETYETLSSVWGQEREFSIFVEDKPIAVTPNCSYPI